MFRCSGSLCEGRCCLYAECRDSVRQAAPQDVQHELVCAAQQSLAEACSQQASLKGQGRRRAGQRGRSAVGCVSSGASGSVHLLSRLSDRVGWVCVCCVVLSVPFNLAVIDRSCGDKVQGVTVDFSGSVNSSFTRNTSAPRLSSDGYLPTQHATSLRPCLCSKRASRFRATRAQHWTTSKEEDNKCLGFDDVPSKGRCMTYLPMPLVNATSRCRHCGQDTRVPTQMQPPRAHQGKRVQAAHTQWHVHIAACTCDGYRNTCRALGSCQQKKQQEHNQMQQLDSHAHRQ